MSPPKGGLRTSIEQQTIIERKDLKIQELEADLLQLKLENKHMSTLID